MKTQRRSGKPSSQRKISAPPTDSEPEIFDQDDPNRDTLPRKVSEPIPELVVNEPVLRFKWALPNQRKFALLIISQRNASTPVTLSTNAPEQFQLACDSRPAFLSRLTLTPASTGTYVHVRYTPNGYIPQQAELRIQTPYETKVVPLIGQSLQLMPSRSIEAKVALPVSLPAPATHHAPPVQRASIPSWVILFGIMVLGEVTFIGYNIRCQIAPGLCEFLGRSSSIESSVMSANSTSGQTSVKRVRQVLSKPVAGERR